MYGQQQPTQWNQQQWNNHNQQPHQQISQQRGQPQQPQQGGQNQGQPQDYSKQWQEYWRQVGSMQDPHGQHSPYNQHGQVSQQVSQHKVLQAVETSGIHRHSCKNISIAKFHHNCNEI